MNNDARSTRASTLEYDVPWCFGDQHRTWQDSMRKFCEQEVAAAAVERDLAHRFDPELTRRLGDLGVYSLLVPVTDDGNVPDLVGFCIAVEELARVDSSLAVTAHVQGISVALFDHLAKEDQKRGRLEAMASGDSFVAFGLTEPSGGSDAGNISTRAERDGSGGWRIHGSKQFITNSGTPFSDYVILFAATGTTTAGRPRVSAFLVPLDAAGVSIGEAYEKMGWRSSDTHPIFFDDVHVGPDALLGEEGRGFAEALRFLTWARIPIAAMSTGVAQGCLEETLDFVDGRESFDAPLGSHQGVAFGVAEIASMAATARVLTYDAAWKHDRGLPYDAEAAICKFVASELANRAGYQATQLHGGYGFIDESDVTRHYRDARILTIGEGTSEVQKMLIARGLGLPV